MDDITLFSVFMGLVTAIINGLGSAIGLYLATRHVLKHIEDAQKDKTINTTCPQCKEHGKT